MRSLWPLVLLLMTGCSAFSAKDNADPPAELVDLEPQLEIKELWDRSFEGSDEAFLKLVDQHRVDWKGRTHFYAVGAQAMRRILVDYARSRGRTKRGGGMKRILLDEAAVFADAKPLDLIELADTLDALASLDTRQAQIVELRFFAGLTVEQVAHVLGVSKRKVEGDWTHAKAWLRSRLGPDRPE